MYQIIKRSSKLYSKNLVCYFISFTLLNNIDKRKVIDIVIYILQFALRKYSDVPEVATLKGGENILHVSLQKQFPQAKEIKIKDISGNNILFKINCNIYL